MLSPKRTKYRKYHRGRMRGKATRGNEICFGNFGLQALEPNWVTSRQIEAARRTITRYTKRGAKFCPSVMLGAGRKVDEQKLWEHANDMIYIFCDVVDFPKVRIIFKHGSDLTQYPKGSIPFKDRNVLFV